jgi:putative addiction module component (TIGR02574 family)
MHSKSQRRCIPFGTATLYPGQHVVEDRIALAQALWDSAAEELERVTLSDDQRQELERRLADSIARPDAVISWEEVKARAAARAQQ